MNRYHKDGTVPDNMDDIFVFGSNLAGIHGAGAAKVAIEQFGAKWGKGFGIMGNSYAIPTKDKNIDTLPIVTVAAFIIEFLSDTHDFRNSDKKWFVTRVGCGLAGYSDSQIAPMFIGARNCSFAESWKPYLEMESL